ncbi:TonB-dependent siderophore receptor [Rubrivivax rivuli]|uniref:TonB-dependent siderophore receptor n=2 Tax=Rubrivivax rivuli TaxID=1862385 RepID=A0A437R9K6_9BURK|nr:TonB-dependent siderophore receptor [Rubrivivax rivuli]
MALGTTTTQAQIAAPAGAASAPAPAPASTVLPVVRARVQAEPAGKDSVQATTTRIGKGQQELRDVPQSVTVVTERLIDDRNLDTLKDTLKNTAGISFLAAEGGEEDIRLRGFSLQATGDIFVDGLRDPAFYERDSFNWDRLEVLRGSASMLFGRGSTGGAVNQVSKLPTLFAGSEVGVTLGNQGYLRGTADLNVKTGDNAALRVNGMVTLGDNHGAKIDKHGIAPSFRWGIGTSDEFLVSLYHLENNNGIHYGLPWLNGKVLPVDPSSYYGALSDVSAGSATMTTLGYTKRFADRSEWKTTLRVGRYERDQRASAVRFAAAALQPGGVAVSEATFGPDTVLQRSGGNGTHAKIQDLDAITFQSDYDKKFQALGLKHSVQAGVDVTKDAFIGFTAANPASGALIKPTITVAQNRGGGWVDESLRVIHKNRDFESEALGAYAQDLVQLSPGWKLLAGLRWDRFEGRYRTYSTATANFGAVTGDRGRSDSLFSERLGALWQPTPLTSFHFSYGTSFNTSGDAYQFDALGSNTPPEKSRNFELGAKIDSESGKATLRLALFHATKYNERNRDEESVSPTNYVLSGQRHAAGFEIDVAGRITPQWEAFVSLAWIPDAEVDRASSVLGTTLTGETVGQRPGLTPKLSGTVWSTYQLTPRLRLGGGLNARSKDTPQQSSIVARGFVTADLMAEFDAGGGLLFKLNVSNLTNMLYAETLYRGHYIAGKPRTVQLSSVFKF